MVAYTIPQQRKKEESERLRGERDQIKFIDLGFERWQAVRFRKGRGRQEENLGFSSICVAYTVPKHRSNQKQSS